MESVLIWFVLIAVGVAHADPRPNIVLFIADDVSAGDFGCYGHPTLRTPHVNALAAGGLRFSNAYLTTSSCSPTRTSLITIRLNDSLPGPEPQTIERISAAWCRVCPLTSWCRAQALRS